ncbi:MAG: 1-deoxy-D-xylulose-5-phosphate synthase [Clostridia bacterium]|nr:1-deoxy-D-xylulose-5-phosphate synthase [Clostridia bacterium]
MLDKINSPRDIKNMSVGELKALCGEIREKIIDTVSENGGHLASNLGIVETVVAIHKVFDTPRDAVIFDVGHQSYAHKMLTGRYDTFGTLRKTGGISGFTNADESEYDVFTEGHSGTALSQALGYAAAMDLAGDDRYVVVVIGDGSFTNGMVYEALNNCKSIGRRLIIILNDNEMSISKNVGGLSRHLTKIRTSRKYFNAKHKIKKFFSKIPWLGPHLISGARRVRDFFKRILLSYNFFEALGVDYIGSANGNDVGKMLNILKEAKTKDMCTVVHIHTTKGKGYAPAERDPAAFHSTPPFNREDGSPKRPSKESFSSVFGNTLCRLAGRDDKICAVTAAMEDGTGLTDFEAKFPDRFFDVGIAEEHAVTFAAGLSKGGARPVVALYSTFAQRTFDQAFHDAAIQKLPLTLCFDRAGIVEGDGITHQGIFDVSEFSSIPGVNIYSPDSYAELEETLEKSVLSDSFDIIRYPKGAETDYDRASFEDRGNCCVAQVGTSGADIAVVTYGRVSGAVYEAAKRSGAALKVIRIKKIIPLPDCFLREASTVQKILVVEEGIKAGGVGEKIASALSDKNIPVRIHAIESFVPHGTLGDLLRENGFSTDALADEIASFAKEEGEK